MPKGTDDDVVGKRKKVQLTTAWLKEAWPLRDAPSVQAMLMADFKTLKKAKTGRSQGVLMDALEDVDKGLRALQAEANRIPRTHPLKKKAITKDLEYARSLVAKELGILAKVGNAMRVVYKKDFGVAMAANLTTQKIEVANRPVTLSLLEALAIELDAKNALNMLNNMLNDAFDQSVKTCTKDVQDIVVSHSGFVVGPAKTSIERRIGREVVSLETEMRDIPVAVFRKMRIHADIAAKYKKDKAVKISKGVVGVGLGIAGTASPGTLPFALVTLARSVASLAKEIVTVLMDLDNEPWPVYFCFTMTCRDFIVPKQRDSGLFI